MASVATASLSAGLSTGNVPTLSAISEPAVKVPDGVAKAWQRCCGELDDSEKQDFESRACNGLDDYVRTLHAACKEHNDASMSTKILQVLEPISKFVELLTPIAKAASSAYPGPPNMVLGGVVGIFQLSTRMLDYQKLTINMLERMSSKASIFKKYGETMYQEDADVQEALIQLYQDMILFCRDGVRTLKKATATNRLEAKVRGTAKTFFRDFESGLGTHVKSFNGHIDDLRDLLQRAHQRQTNDIHTEQRRLGDGMQQFGEVYLMSQKRQAEERKTDELILQQRTRFRAYNEKVDWLSSLDFDSLLDKRCQEHHEGSGTWFTTDKRYTAWKTSHTSNVLWVRGKPGCGKSFLSAIAVTDLQAEQSMDTAVAYCLCRRQNREKETLVSIYGSLIQQILKVNYDIIDGVEKEFLKIYRTQQPTESVLHAVALKMAPTFKQIYLILDALDECTEGDRLLRKLLSLSDSLPEVTVKLLVFNRHHWDLDRILELNQPGLAPIEPENHNEHDLKEYISFRFPDDGDEEFRANCLEKARGMFLWVNLLHESFRGPLTSKDKKKRLAVLPPGLDNIYTLILGDILAQQGDLKERAVLVLLWVTYAYRALKFQELLEAIADFSDVSKVEDLDTYSTPAYLVELCMNLVCIDEDDNVRFIHDSVQNFLDSEPSGDSSPLHEFQRFRVAAHERLSGICLNYLALEDFTQDPPTSVAQLKELLKRCRFLTYAAESWGRHALLGMTDSLRTSISDFIESEPSRELSIQIALFDAEDSESFRSSEGTVTILHVLALFGLKEVAASMMGTSFTHDADTAGFSPLSYSLLKRHHQMSLWLIEKIQHDPQQNIRPIDLTLAAATASAEGWVDVLQLVAVIDRSVINVRSTYAYDRTPLYAACIEGQSGAATTLLDLGAEVLDQQALSDALVAAASTSLLDVVQAILEKGIDPNSTDCSGLIAVHCAAQADDEAVIKALHDHGADLGATIEQHLYTPLHYAAFHNSEKAVNKMLRLNKSLDTNPRSRAGSTPLHIAAECNATKVVATLCARRCKKDEVDGNHKTALYIAVDYGHVNTAVKLLDLGCDPLQPDAVGDTVLHLAAWRADLVIVKEIIERNFKHSVQTLLDARNNSEETPLHCAIAGGNLNLVDFMLVRKADVHAKSGSGNSVLHYAAMYGHATLIPRFIDALGDANLRNGTGNTPLHLAINNGKSEFVQKYVEYCATSKIHVDFQAKNEWQQSPLFRAVATGDERISEYLWSKEPPVDLHAHDEDKNTLLHHAAWQGMSTVITRLLADGGHGRKGYYGRTPVMCAANCGKLEAVQALCAVSTANVNEVDDDGLAPVMVALSREYIDIVECLLDAGADISVKNSTGSSLLHVAADLHAFELFQRLILQRADPETRDMYDQTVFHKAVNSGSMQMLELLIIYGINHCQTCNIGQEYCDVLAASSGSLPMLQSLEYLRAPIGTETACGCNAAHFAATEGHTEVLEWLQEKGVDMAKSDRDGSTPLMEAAGAGCEKTVQHLLKLGGVHPSAVDIHTGENAVMMAASRCFRATTSALCNAAADVAKLDIFGVSPLEAMIRNKWLPAEEFGCLVEQEWSRSQARCQREVIVSCARNILILGSGTDDLMIARQRLIALDLLTKGLRLQGDIETAGISALEHYWPAPGDIWRRLPECFFCKGALMPDVFVCECCYGTRYLCNTCHEDYVEAGKKMPALWERIWSLERAVRQMRSILEPITLIHDAWKVLVYFVQGSEAIGRTVLRLFREEYSKWNQQYHAKKRCYNFKPASQEWVELILEWDELVGSAMASESVSQTQKSGAEGLVRKYSKHRRVARAGKELASFTCDGHQYHLISEKDKKRAKDSGLLMDRETEKLKPRFFEKILLKYQTDGRERQSDAAVHSNAGDTTVHGSGSRNSPESFPSPSRSNTMPYPMRRMSTIAAGNEASLPMLAPRRSLTNPLQPGTKLLQTQATSQKLLDTAVSALHSEDGARSIDGSFSARMARSGAVRQLTSDLSSSSPAIIPAEVADGRTGANNASGPSSPPDGVSAAGSSILALTLSTEPEAIDTGANAADVHDEDTALTTTATNEELRLKRRLSIARDIHLRELENDEERRIWKFAMELHEVMMPGFQQRYLL